MCSSLTTPLLVLLPFFILMRRKSFSALRLPITAAIQKHILPEYLAHYMRSFGFKTQYLQVMRQSTRNQVPITKQREFYHVDSAGRRAKADHRRSSMACLRTANASHPSTSASSPRWRH